MTYGNQFEWDNANPYDDDDGEEQEQEQEFNEYDDEVES